MNEGFIKCPFILISTYIDRMVKDWGKGHIYVVIENNNWKNQSFVNYFSHHLKQLEPSKLSYLVHIVDHECQDTALAFSCRYGNVNFAELCFNMILHENPEQEQCKLCALFLLVVFRNKKLKTTRLIISCVRSAFLDLSSSGTLKAKHLKSEGCVSTETVEELYDKNT